MSDLTMSNAELTKAIKSIREMHGRHTDLILKISENLKPFGERLESLEDQLKAPGDQNTMSNAELTAAVNRIDAAAGALEARTIELEKELRSSAYADGRKTVGEVIDANSRAIDRIGRTVDRHTDLILELEKDDEEPIFTGDQLDEVCRLKKELEVTSQNLDTYIERFEEQQSIVEQRDKEVRKLLEERNNYWWKWKRIEKRLQAAARALEANGFKIPSNEIDRFMDED